jgi:hypothetical protein
MKARDSLGSLVKSQFCLYYKPNPWQYHPRPLSERTMSLTHPFTMYPDNPYLSDIVEDKLTQEQGTDYFWFSLD